VQFQQLCKSGWIILSALLLCGLAALAPKAEAEEYYRYSMQCSNGNDNSYCHIPSGNEAACPNSSSDDHDVCAV